MEKLNFYLKSLKLPVILSCYAQEALESEKSRGAYEGYLTRLCELEVLGRQSRQIMQKIQKAHFPSFKALDLFDFKVVSAENQRIIETLALGGYIERGENVLLMGASGMGKTHLAIGLGIRACQQGHTVLFQTASHLTQSLIEAYDEKRLLSLKKRSVAAKLLIVDEFGYVPFSKIGSELLFDLLSERHERGSLIITSNLPFEEWSQILGTERLTCALLDRLTHHAHILQMNGQSYRLASRSKKTSEQ